MTGWKILAVWLALGLVGWVTFAGLIVLIMALFRWVL